jgi:hypothetical protein
MDQKKNQGQQSDRRDMPPSGTESREKGRGGQAERNLGGGISKRDIDRELEELEEQDELPDRQSER